MKRLALEMQMQQCTWSLLTAVEKRAFDPKCLFCFKSGAWSSSNQSTPRPCLARCWRLGRLAPRPRNAAQCPLQPGPAILTSSKELRMSCFVFICLLFAFFFYKELQKLKAIQMDLWCRPFSNKLFFVVYLPNVCSRLVSGFTEGLLPSMRVAGKVQGGAWGLDGGWAGCKDTNGAWGGRDKRCPWMMWCCLERMADI